MRSMSDDLSHVCTYVLIVAIALMSYVMITRRHRYGIDQLAFSGNLQDGWRVSLGYVQQHGGAVRGQLLMMRHGRAISSVREKSFTQ